MREAGRNVREISIAIAIVRMKRAELIIFALLVDMFSNELIDATRDARLICNIKFRVI